MSYKFQRSVILFLLLNVFWVAAAFGAERHEDLPITTSWSFFRFGQQAQSESGLEAQRLAVLFLEPDAGWYAYAHEPGGFAKPTRLSASFSGRPLRVLYPLGTPKDDLLTPGAKILAYVGKTPLFVLLDASGGELSAQLELLLCTREKCYPAKLDLMSSVPSGALPDARGQSWWPELLLAAKRAAAEPQPSTEPAPLAGEKATALTQEAPFPGDWSGLTPQYHLPELEVGGLLKAVLLGLLAGLILNFMPCVLPVISIKLSSLMASSSASNVKARHGKFREHNLYFALGILLYFLVLSGVLGATGLAWGHLFQEPLVIMLLTAFVFALSLSLLGVFSLPIVDLKFDQMTTHPKLQALLTGLLVTLLATPCSGPFLGGVLGWALIQPPWVISTVMVVIGAGMALPYLVMALFPVLVRLFPKPGPWAGHLEKAVGLLLVGTCIYLLSILPVARLIPTLLLLWFTAVGAWVWGAARPGFDSAKIVLLKLVAVLLLGLGLWLGFRAPASSAHLVPYSETSLRAMLGKQTVLVGFTADWCPSCKVLEQTTLTSVRLGDMKKRYNLNLMVADLTENNPEAEALLHALGSKSIPVWAIFPKNAPERPLVLRDLFTPAQLEKALESTARP
jgi:thiol:disulfide interchange protein DsbD